MNILIVPPNDLITNVLPNRLYHLARFWSRRHKIFLLRYLNYPTSTNIERPLEHVSVTFKARPAKEPGRYYIVNAPAIYRALRKTLEQNKIDVIVHANIVPSAIAVRLARKFSVKTVFDYLDHFPESASAYYTNRTIKWLARNTVSLLTNYNLRNSDEIVTVSHYLRNLIERRIGRRVHLVPNGVDPEVFKPLPKDSARRELRIEDREPVLLYYGSIAEWIDYSLLLRLAARLKENYSKLLLLMVGNIHTKADEARISMLIRELRLEATVRIEPPQPQERVPLYISAADVVVAPTKDWLINYTTPVKIFETLSCGRPILLPALPEYSKWLPSYPFFYTSEAELESKTREILSNPEKAMEALQDVREYVVRAFSWQSLAEAYERLLEGTT